MKFYRFFLLKAYFDKGFSLTGYFKYALAFSGVFNLITAKVAIYIALFYVLSCFLIGWIWFKCGFVNTENEIQNLFNPFQQEVRATLRKRKTYK